MRTQMTAIAVSTVLVLGPFNTSCGKAEPPARKASAKTSQAETPPIQVKVTRLAVAPGRIEYHYNLVNGSAFPVTTLLVGYDEHYGRPMLSAEPIGWDGDTIPSGSFQAPPRWNFAPAPMQEDTLMAIKWVVSQHGSTILGGTSAEGFAVVLPRDDPAYGPGGTWTVYVMGESPFSGTIQSSGVTGVPISSVFAKSDLKVSPNPAGKSVQVQFAMPIAGVTTIDVFDVQGRRVKRVLGKPLTLGDASVSWDGRDESGRPIASGIYFMRVKTPSTLRFARFTWH